MPGRQQLLGDCSNIFECQLQYKTTRTTSTTGSGVTGFADYVATAAKINAHGPPDSCRDVNYGIIIH